MIILIIILIVNVKTQLLITIHPIAIKLWLVLVPMFTIIIIITIIIINHSNNNRYEINVCCNQLLREIKICATFEWDKDRMGCWRCVLTCTVYHLWNHNSPIINWIERGVDNCWIQHRLFFFGKRYIPADLHLLGHDFCRERFGRDVEEQEKVQSSKLSKQLLSVREFLVFFNWYNGLLPCLFTCELVIILFNNNNNLYDVFPQTNF